MPRRLIGHSIKMQSLEATGFQGTVFITSQGKVGLSVGHALMAPCAVWLRQVDSSPRDTRYEVTKVVYKARHKPIEELKSTSLPHVFVSRQFFCGGWDIAVATENAEIDFPQLALEIQQTMPPGSLNSRWGGNPTDCSTTLPYEALRVRFYPRENPPFDATIRASQSAGESNDKKYPEVRVSDVGYPGLSGCTVLCDGHFFGNYAARETSRKGTLERVSKIASAVKYQGGGMMLEKDSCSVRLDLTAASRGEIRVEGASATQRSTAYWTEYSPRTEGPRAPPRPSDRGVLPAQMPETISQLAAFMLQLHNSTNTRIDSTNARIDSTNARIDSTNALMLELHNSTNAQFESLHAALGHHVRRFGIITPATTVCAALEGGREQFLDLDALDEVTVKMSSDLDIPASWKTTTAHSHELTLPHRKSGILVHAFDSDLDLALV